MFEASDDFGLKVMHVKMHNEFEYSEKLKEMHDILVKEMLKRGISHNPENECKLDENCGFFFEKGEKMMSARIRPKTKTSILCSLKNFDDVKVEYDVQGNESKVLSLSFGEDWNEAKAFMWMQENFNKIFNFSGNISDFHEKIENFVGKPKKLSIGKIKAKKELASDNLSLPYVFDMVAIKEGEWNGEKGGKIFWSYDEIAKGAQSMIGKKVKVDHNRSLRDVAGIVIDARPDPVNRWLEVTIEIPEDIEIAKKVNAGLADGSIEAWTEDVSIDGKTHATKIEYAGFGLVEEGACSYSKKIDKPV